MAKYEIPEIPGSNVSEPEVLMSHCLERIVSYGTGDSRTKSWWTSRARSAARKYIGELPNGMQGRSWNHAVAAGVLHALMENKHWDDLRQYAVFQLDGTHKGLWGQEAVSHNYPHPVPYLSVLYEKRKSRKLEEVRKVLRAHALMLALMALPKPYRREARNDPDPQGPYSSGDKKLSQHVCAGGMRSQWAYRGNVYLSYALECILGRNKALPTWRNTHRRRQGWSCRVMRHTGHAYLTQADRDLMAGQIAGAEVVPMVQALTDLGVRSHARLHVLRWPGNQGASYFETHTHQSTPPIMGQSFINHHGYRTLCMHPEKLRGTPNGNKVGKATARRDGDRIFGRVEGIKAHGNQGAWPPCEINGGPPPGSGSGTAEASIPIPEGDPLYEVVVDQQGIRRLGDPPVVQPPGETQPPDPPPPATDDPRVTQALGLFHQVATGSGDPWIQQGIATGAEVLRRICRPDKPGAIAGSKTLTAVLED